MQTEDKRCRSANFSMEEKMLCLNIIKKYSQVVESKKTDAYTWKDKQNAWEQIGKEFNSQSPAGIFRSVDVLKKFFDNKKKECRKIAAEMNKTGGGTPSIKMDNCIYELIMCIINKKSVFGLTSPFGGDSIEEPEIEEILIISPENEEYNIEGTFKADKSKELVDCGNDKTEQKTPKKRKNEQQIDWTERRRPRLSNSTSLARKYEDLTDTKKKVSDLQLEILKLERQEIVQKTNREEEAYQLKKERHDILFQLQKESLSLDIEIKKMQLEKLKYSD